jgi:hypothetical protein
MEPRWQALIGTRITNNSNASEAMHHIATERLDFTKSAETMSPRMSQGPRGPLATQVSGEIPGVDLVF